MPSREEIVEALYDKDLDSFAHEVVEVSYSRDRAVRYVILKKNNGLLTYLFEKIVMEDPEEWERLRDLGMCRLKAAGWWEELDLDQGKSFFSTMEELKRELVTEPCYGRYFL